MLASKTAVFVWEYRCGKGWIRVAQAISMRSWASTVIRISAMG